MKRKVLSLLTAALCLVPFATGLFGMGESASAAEAAKVTVTLHKKKMDEFPTNPIPNNGEEDADWERFEGLPGVTFEPFDVTSDFYAKFDDELTGSETPAQYQAAMKNFMKTYQLPSGATSAASPDVTDSNGDVTFQLDRRAADGTYKVYYFEETIPSGIDAEKHQGHPVILVLPAVTEDGTVLDDIHLYPKNKMDGELKKELLDEDGNPIVTPAPDDYYSYEIGKKISYRAAFTIPSQIGEVVEKTVSGSKTKQTRYAKLSFEDQVSQKGVLFEGISKIVIGGQELKDAKLAEFMANFNADYKINDLPNYDKDKFAGFKLSAKLHNVTEKADPTKYAESAKTAAALAEYGGKTIEIYYAISFTKDTPVDQQIDNSFGVFMNRDGKDDNKVVDSDDLPPSVGTGGRKFVKHEENKDDKKLDGAEFAVTRVKDGKTQYLVQSADKKNTWTEYTNKSELSAATKFVSKNGGAVEVTGLEFGDYKLVETKAPNGFLLPDTPFNFTVSSGSYGATSIMPLPNVSNGGFLPSTGGAGIIAFLVVGLSLMGIAIFKYRRLQDQAI
ncbi:pilus protein [Enterococcus florum]|uniref:Pilus protein n=1 Tax=Enterococcus florum TaxID=2480627 RepID=A0A4P5P9B3_9ENTE|nr:SpaH/EbpB family LPXTG-anchored major pilin [Enterococcus florum]GCF94146.1 pilus protein [Enterococcus florum]